jgi:anhydro-N-acetylmuramic acid kinase
VQATLKRHKVKLDLIGCHGQTLFHQAQPSSYAGRRFACTWQAGEPGVIATALGIPVVSNFRPADMVAGGQGAPLVPLFDYVMFADLKRGRVLQNIGGIANLTAIPPAATPAQLIAFDTGPGNMVIDDLALQLFAKPFDRNGAIAATGNVLDPVLQAELRNPYYRLKPPRTAGREQFGREYTAKFLSACKRHSHKPEDALATATALTAETIAISYKRFAAARVKDQPHIDGDAGAAIGTARLRIGDERAVWFTSGSKRGRCIRTARVADLESSSGKCACRHGRCPGCNPGPGNLCVACSPLPYYRYSWVVMQRRVIHKP